MSTFSSSAWSETVPGTFTRRFDTLETFYKTVSVIPSVAQENLVVSLVLRLRLPTSIHEPDKYIERAWLHTRHLHPHLGALADVAGPSTVTVAPLQADDWLSQSFRRLEKENDLLAVFAANKPTPTVTCHYVTESGEVYFRGSHWRVDGRGLLALAHSFLTSLTSILTLGLDADLDSYHGDPPVHGSLMPSVDGLTNPPADEDATPAHVSAVADALIADFVSGIPSIGFPPLPGSDGAPVADTRRHVVALDEAATAAVVAACKRRGLSVTTAVHAAILRAAAAYPQHPLARSYASMYAIDGRPYLPTPQHGGGALAAGNFTMGLAMRVPDVVGKSFDAIAADLGAVYSRDLKALRWKEGEEPVSLADLEPAFVRRATAMATAPMPPGLPLPRNPIVNSLGIAERFLQREYGFGAGAEKVIVEDLWMGLGCLAQTPQFHLWTFRDRLSVHVSYNVRDYTDDFMREVLERVRDELLTGLEIAI